MIKITHPTKVVKGTVSLPSSKSISNRALIIQALCSEPFTINNLSEAEDTHVLKEILNNKPTIANVGDAGTAMRFLLAYFSTIDNEQILTGSARMQQRPIGLLVDALRKMGAEITYLENDGYPPIKIKGSQNLLNKVTVRSDVSSQFVSALMLIGPAIKGGLEIVFEGEPVSFSYIELTRAIMYFMDADIELLPDENRIVIEPVEYQANYFVVEPDWSAASYFFEIAALAKEAAITLGGLPVNTMQGDGAVMGLFEALFNLNCKPVANTLPTLPKSWGGVSSTSVHITKEKKQLRIDDAEYDFTDMPDMAQTIAATAVGAGIGFYLSGLKTLRIKETDRITALKNELEKAGAVVEVGDDWLHIKPGTQSTSNSIAFNVYNDHRMAMALAPLALVFDEVIIEDEAVVSKSFPGYWDELKKLGFVISV